MPPAASFDDASFDDDFDHDIDDIEDGFAQEGTDEPSHTCVSCGGRFPELADHCPYCGYWKTREGEEQTNPPSRWIVAAAWLSLALILSSFVIFRRWL